VQELEEVRQLGADVVVPFSLGADHPGGAAGYEEALKQAFSGGIDVVIDYLWGESAKTAIVALAKSIEDRPVRFVHVGGAGGEPEIRLPGAALRSSALTLMGSGVGSVSRKALVKIATQTMPLAQVESVWEQATGKPRVVFTIG
jgi:hypothetical protein